jgi:hypothetical protein
VSAARHEEMRMSFRILALAAALAAGPALAEAPAEKPPTPPEGAQPVWGKTKVVVCEVLLVQNCRPGGCEAAQKLPSFRIDISKQTMCGIVGGGCKAELKIGQVGFDRANTRMTVHALGAAFIVGIDDDGTMNGADVVRGRVVTIQGRCVPG